MLELDQDDVWTPAGQLVRTKTVDGTVRASYLRGTSLAYFLSQIKQGEWFTYKDVRFVDGYGSGDFYTIKDWLTKLNLIERGTNSSYRVPNVSAVFKAWNHAMDATKFKM